MIPERWQVVKQVLDEALAVDTAARGAYLDVTCAGDTELRHEVESLLASNPPAGSYFLDSPPVQLREPGVSADRQSYAGRRIGPYQLIEEIGRGGMGEVHRAQRADGQYDQQVAIKLIRSGYHEARYVLERFRTERQILATLDHPNIARLLDGGATENGTPYLVMELVHGTSIHAYCDSQKLNITARLQLFRQVCSAVQYAHQRLIVHRDIKPSNILVADNGVPKLLDFGIAKILDGSGDAEVTIHRPMTLAYASPEQMRGEPVTTVSDVYSLGVVLYQLLSGHFPYRVDVRTASELWHAIAEKDAPRPSVVIGRTEHIHRDGSRLELTPELVSAAREGSVPKLARRLSGDLDQIVLKALRKEPDQRYASVEQLSEDIQRHLDGFPVSARRGTWTYQAQKFVRRHRVGMAAAALVALVTVAGVVATLREARIAAANARRAEQRFEDVRRLANFMVFDVHDAIRGLPGATKPRELIVRRGLEYLDRLAGEAGNDFSLLGQISLGYIRLGNAQGEPGESNLGDAAGAARSYRKAIAILDGLHARDPGDQEVTSNLEQALRALTRVLDSSSERQALARRALTLSQAEAAAHPDDVRAQRTFGDAVFELGRVDVADRRYSDAAAEFRTALALYQGVNERHPTVESARSVALCQKRLGALSLVSGDLPAAVDAYEAARAIDERIVADDPHSTQAKLDLSFDLSDLGTTLWNMKRAGAALEAYDRATALRREAHQADPLDSRARHGLAAILLRRGELLLNVVGKPTEAVGSFEEAVSLWSLEGGPSLGEHGATEYWLSKAYARLGKTREERLHREAALAILADVNRRGSLMPNEKTMYAELRHP